MTNPAGGIDHLVVPVEDPDDLFACLTERLGLPALWPVTDLGPFRSGGVALGNCWIEIVAGAESLTPAYAPALPATFKGIAFRTATDCESAAAALDRMGVARGETQAVSGRRPDGTDGPLVTILPMDGLLGDGGVVYLCEMALPVDDARVARRTAKSAAEPESVGIEEVTEVQIGVRDVATAAAAWERIVPHAEPALWRPPVGPAVRLRESPIDGVSGIVVRVRSLGRARDALSARGLLGPVRDAGIGVNHAATHGLDIWLTQERSRRDAPASPRGS